LSPSPPHRFASPRALAADEQPAIYLNPGRIRSGRDDFIWVLYFALADDASTSLFLLRSMTAEQGPTNK
jgi:hypothetical protein